MAAQEQGPGSDVTVDIYDDRKRREVGGTLAARLDKVFILSLLGKGYGPSKNAMGLRPSINNNCSSTISVYFDCLFVCVVKIVIHTFSQMKENS